MHPSFGAEGAQSQKTRNLGEADEVGGKQIRECSKDEQRLLEPVLLGREVGLWLSVCQEANTRKKAAHGHNTRTGDRRFGGCP